MAMASLTRGGAKPESGSASAVSPAASRLRRRCHAFIGIPSSSDAGVSLTTIGLSHVKTPARASPAGGKAALTSGRDDQSEERTGASPQGGGRTNQR